MVGATSCTFRDLPNSLPSRQSSRAGDRPTLTPEVCLLKDYKFDKEST